MNVPFSTKWRRRTLCDLGEFIEDSAVLRLLPTQAGLTQALELLFQLAQFLDPFCHMADVFVQELIDFKAILSRCVFESQQDAYLIQRHVQPSAMPDEGQALRMGCAINAVIAIASTGLSQQILALVETYGFDLSVRQSSKFTDFHGSLQKGLTL